MAHVAASLLLACLHGSPSVTVIVTVTVTVTDTVTVTVAVAVTVAVYCAWIHPRITKGSVSI